MNQLTTIYKLLSDDTRLRMLLLLDQQDLCVCQISGILGAPQPRVSKNLSKLRDLNLVVDERREKFVFYTLKKDNLLLSQTLQLIRESMDQYPQIQLDSDMLVDKEKFLNLCCTIIES